MTNISVYDSSAAKLTRTTMSMRDFVRSHNHDLFIFDQVPAYLMWVTIHLCDVMTGDSGGEKLVHELAFELSTSVIEQLSGQS